MKDTVLTTLELDERFDISCPYEWETIKAIQEAQAEISYKAGIKLVVDWLKENSWDDDGVQCFIPTDWQAQVKEWEYGQE